MRLVLDAHTPEFRQLTSSPRWPAFVEWVDRQPWPIGPAKTCDTDRLELVDETGRRVLARYMLRGDDGRAATWSDGEVAKFIEELELDEPVPEWVLPYFIPADPDGAR